MTLAEIAPGLRLLTQDEFDLLDPRTAAEYLTLLETLGNQWRLQARQEWCDILADYCDEILFGGALGGGKSELVVWRAHEKSLAIPGHATLILRESFPELSRSIIRRGILRIPESEAKYRASEKQWHYPNSSVIELGYLESDEDVRNYLSAEYDMVMIDEATSQTAYRISMVASRLRTTTAKRRHGARPHLFLTTNPGGPGHAFVKRRYYDGTRRGQALAIYPADADQDDPETRPIDYVSLPELPRHPHDWDAVDALRDALAHFPATTSDEMIVGFVPSKLEDNAYLDKTYRRRINAMPEIERKQAGGDWDVFAGQFFAELSREIHMVEPFDVPHDWYRARGVDWGWNRPFACVWGAWSPDGDCYIYRELYGAGITTADQARQIVAASICRDTTTFKDRNERISTTVADPSAFHQTGAGDSNAKVWTKHGVPVRKANNNRIAGWANVREYLKADPIRTRPDDPTRKGAPHLYVFSTCENWWRTMPAMVHSKTIPEDLDTRTEDHIADATRYLLAVKPFRTLSRRRYHRGRTLAEVETRHLEQRNVNAARRRMQAWRTS